MQKWTKEQADFVRANYQTMSQRELAEHIGKTHFAVKNWCFSQGLKKHEPLLTDEEKKYIERYFGQLSYDEMAKTLGCKERKVRYYCNNYLGSEAEALGDRVTIAELSNMVGMSTGNIRITWIKRHGLKTTHCGLYHFVKLDDLYEFMKNNPDRWEASKCEDWFFSDQDWFVQRKKEEFERMVDRRWGKWKNESCQH